MKSMTGYGMSNGVVEGFGLACELKTLNGRYLDVNVRLPRELSMFEVPIIIMLKSKFSRGSVFLNVTVKSYEYKQRWPFTIDSKKAGLYIELLKTMKKALKLKGQITVDVFTHSPDFFLKEDKPVKESALNDMINVIEEAVKKTALMREVEGEEIKKEIRSLINNIQSIVKNIEEKMPAAVNQIKQKTTELLHNLKHLPVTASISPEAIIGNYIDKIDINEEVKRIQSHIKALSQLLEEKGTIGKRIEFFTQEFIREFNTIAAKGIVADITTFIIDAKNAIERIKELAQNIE